MAAENTRNHDIGKWGEAKAAEYLKKNGYLIVEMNYRRKTGEIDIIAYEGDMLCFIEVKTRSRLDFGFPCEAVDFRKKARLLRTADYYIAENRLSESQCRMDIIEIVRNAQGDCCRHLKNAFSP